MNVIWELRCPKCRGFISGYQADPGMAIVARCTRCPLTFEGYAQPARRGVDIARIHIQSFAYPHPQ